MTCPHRSSLKKESLLSICRSLKCLSTEGSAKTDQTEFEFMPGANVIKVFFFTHYITAPFFQPKHVFLICSLKYVL